MKKTGIRVVAIMVMGLLLLLSLCACGKSFICDWCGAEKTGKKHNMTIGDGKYTLCDDCYTYLSAVEGAFKDNSDNSGSIQTTNAPAAGKDEKRPLFKDGSVVSAGPFIDGIAQIVGQIDYKTWIAYVDTKGEPLLFYHRSYNSMTDDRILYGIGTNSFLISKDSGVYELYDHQGTLLKTFEIGNQTIGALSESLFFVEETVKNVTGNRTDMVYYDESGKEVLRFENKTNAGPASCFFDNRAFICRRAEKDELSNMHLGENWPTDWVEIAPDGLQWPLRLADPTVLTQGEVFDMLATEPDDILGYIVLDVKPFYPGEDYASAVVQVQTKRGSSRFPACISRDGQITIAPSVHGSNFGDNEGNLTQCYRGMVIIDNQRIWDVRNNTISDFYSNPTIKSVGELAEKDNPYYHFSYYLRFIEDGSFYLGFFNKDMDYYSMILSKDGTVIRDAWLSDRYNWSSPYSSYKFVYGTKWSHQDTQYCFTPIISIGRPVDSKNNEEYVFLDGRPGFGGDYTIRGQFNEGYAIVCTNSEKYYYMTQATDPAIIDESGKIICYLYE